LDLHLLSALDAEGRILADGVMDGFCPGEGAAFLLLSADREPEPGHPKRMAFVSAPGLALEAGHRYSDEPYRGDGLAQAIALALAALAGRPASTVLGSLNGENFGAKEWGVAYLRNQASLAEPLRFEHPADCLGDVGAACAPLLIGLAAMGIAAAYREDPCLIWCSSDTALRGAASVTLDRPGEA